MKKIKSTRSLCPVCYRDIEATVINTGEKVYMEKKCAEHGLFNALLEQNIDFYYRLISCDTVNGDKEFIKLALPVTYRCNMRCPMCYEPSYKEEDPPLGNLLDVIDTFNGELIKITGGEPTLREDLPVIIEAARKKGKRCSLVTNGIKLADYEYVKKLKKSGLRNVALSFSSFSDEIYKIIRGEAVLAYKMKALSNLKKAGIRVVLSTTLVRGVNEGELKNIYEYYLANRSFIKLLRLRSMSCVGNFLKVAPFSIYEMIEKLSEVTGFSTEELIESNIRASKEGYSVCRYDVSIYSAFWRNLESKMRKKGIFLLLSGILKSFKVFGLKQTWKPEYCFITIRSWPDKDRIDLDEIKSCPTGMLTKTGEIESFCYANIIKEKNCCS